MAVYPNATINEGSAGSFIATGAVALYDRLKFVAPASGDGKATVSVAGIAERGDCVAMCPGADGDLIQVRFLNAPGEQFGKATEVIAVGGDVYTAANGDYSTTAGGGALKVGKATSAGAAAEIFTWIPFIPAA